MENKDIDKAAREIPQGEHDACNYANGILSKVRDADFTLFPKSIIWAVAHDAYLSRQSEIDELREALEEIYKVCSNIEAMNTHGNGKAALIRNYAQLWWPKATQLLEKYGKKDKSIKPKE